MNQECPPPFMLLQSRLHHSNILLYNISKNEYARGYDYSFLFISQVAARKIEI